MEVLGMRPRAFEALAIVLACSGCGLFLDDLSKGAAEPVDTATDTDTGTDVAGTPCPGADLSVDPCCDLEDSCGLSYVPMCLCATCPWDAAYCSDGGTPDAGGDTDTNTDVVGIPCDGFDLAENPCCNVENLCDWNNNGACDCDGACEWDEFDCGVDTDASGVGRGQDTGC
jgi:hypothetical protein